MRSKLFLIAATVWLPSCLGLASPVLAAGAPGPRDFPGASGPRTQALARESRPVVSRQGVTTGTLVSKKKKGLPSNQAGHLDAAALRISQLETALVETQEALAEARASISSLQTAVSSLQSTVGDVKSGFDRHVHEYPAGLPFGLITKRGFGAISADALMPYISPQNASVDSSNAKPRQTSGPKFEP